MKETQAHKELKKLYPRAHIQRMEGWVAGGILDLNMCQDGVEAWVELKKVDRPKTKRGMIKPAVMPGQIAWEQMRRMVGGRTFVAMMVNFELYLLPGWCLKELYYGMTQDRLEELKLDETSLFVVK